MNINKEELLRRLKVAEPYNNGNIPKWVFNIINGMPSAERKGHWIDTDEFGEWWQKKYQCSECGAQAWNATMNYCPDCGVDMRGEEE